MANDNGLCLREERLPRARRRSGGWRGAAVHGVAGVWWWRPIALESPARVFLGIALHVRWIVDWPWWGYVLVTLGLTHVTIAAVTIFLHRQQAHRALELHPLVAHFFRLWLWLTTGMVTREWAAIHRKHHARCETAEDPHSPQVHGIHRVLWTGVFLYVREARNLDTLQRYGHGTPTTGSRGMCTRRGTSSASSSCWPATWRSSASSPDR
jgi:fatty-acid desaturase